MKILEKDVIRNTLDILKLHGFKTWRINNAGIWNPNKKVYIFHGNKGVPDIFSCNGKSALWIECKGTGGKLTPEQKEFLDAVQDTKSYSAVVYGGSVEFEKFETFVKRVKS